MPGFEEVYHNNKISKNSSSSHFLSSPSPIECLSSSLSHIPLKLAAHLLSSSSPSKLSPFYSHLKLSFFSLEAPPYSPLICFILSIGVRLLIRLSSLSGVELSKSWSSPLLLTFSQVCDFRSAPSVLRSSSIQATPTPFLS